MKNSNRRILFICPDTNTPSGGVKQLYRQVDILNKNGFQAHILHGQYGFKCKWFNNATSILYNSALFADLASKNPVKPRKNMFKVYKKALKDVIQLRKTLKDINDKKKDTVITATDILVFPETYGAAINQVLAANDKVIYNQNCYYTFAGYGFNDQDTAYTHSKVIAIIVASIDAANYMKYAFPGTNLFRVHYGIDKKVFNFSANKKKQIAFMPRKLREDIIQVINLLKFRNILNDWKLVEIVNMKEGEVANLLKDSAVFLSFNNREGFGMPPAEAMACGCTVIGYPGRGGEEYFSTEFSYPIADRDVQNFAKTLEQVLVAYEQDSKPFLEKGKLASDFILREYSIEVEEQDIVNVWDEILGLPALQRRVLRL